MTTVRGPAAQQASRATVLLLLPVAEYSSLSTAQAAAEYLTSASLTCG